MDGTDIGRFWGNGDCHFDHVDATGRSGGLISICDPKKSVKVSVDKHRNFLTVYWKMKDSGKDMTIINMYAPQKLIDKKALWTELEWVIVQDSSYWIVGGDFNCVRDRSERRNSKFIASATNDFKEFLDGVGLHEYGLRGRKFTIVSGNKCSRIDRLFVSWSFLNDWPNAEYRALAREKSDHSPLILKVEYRNFGAKPFHFFNSWLYRDGFDDVVVKAASDFNGSGPPDIVLMNKFKRIRQEIVKWRMKLTVNELEEEANLQ
ncbi:uncharacterized protein LOC110893012 [Helianthus annuus]|uniref:uncharacterized protein LOC110893012 n=1 Tax=Helianthus annuus TaxID=4232 RepID=UPI000B8FC971|nr:uncharacterized protein LOC110893012 [Helianthus annuus]